MILRILSATFVLALATSGLSAQTIRFDTNVGTFDMELNPTGNPFLQGHVDNMLAYVMAGRYDKTVINRVNEVDPRSADSNFVMQMGGFRATFLTLPSNFNQFSSVPTFDALIVDQDGDGNIDFDTAGLTNSRTTVSMALSAAGPNSATSSFFVNLNDIPALDPGGSIGEFVPFAEIINMATVDLIQGLDTAAIPGGGVGSSNIPILEGDHLVFVERAFVVNTSQAMIESALANNTLSDELSGELNGETDESLSSALSVTSVPEPSTALLAAACLLTALGRRRFER